jgi:NADPH:quinone reductase
MYFNLVTGARGGIGSLAVQLAEKAGTEVTGVSAVTDEVEGLYDVILESVGGASLAAAVQHIASHGIIVAFGNSSNEPTSISLYDFFGHKVRGCRPFSPIMQAIEIIGEDPAV